MDRQELVDQINAIDLQIGRVGGRAKDLQRDMRMRDGVADVASDRKQLARDADEVAGLVEQKRALRVRISEI